MRVTGQCLAVCGTDFEMMKEFYPKRNREQIKHKYRRERRNDPEVVEQWINQQGFSIEKLEEEYKEDVSSAKKLYKWHTRSKEETE